MAAKSGSPQRRLSEENWDEELAQEDITMLQENATSSREDTSSKESSVEKEV